MSMSMSEQRELAELRLRVTALEQRMALPSSEEHFTALKGPSVVADAPPVKVEIRTHSEPYQDTRGMWRIKGRKGAFKSRESALAR